MKKEKEKYTGRNRYQVVTDAIIAAMEKGELPWQQGWDSRISAAMIGVPVNGTSKKPYNLENTFYLMTRTKELGSDDPRYFTFKQANQMGYGIRKSEHGTYIKQSFYKTEDDDGNELPPDEQRWEKTYSYVYNASQLCMREKVLDANGNPKLDFKGKPIFKNTDKPIPKYVPNKRRYNQDETIEIADDILRKSGAKIYNDQASRAFYRPSADEIHLPKKEAFHDLESYYSTALHELGHWTGHKSRLNRQMGNSFGSVEYAKEELRAEMASVYLSISLDLPINSTNHAAYTQSWLKILKNDKMEFFRAVSDAQKIAKYVKSITNFQEKEFDEVVTIDNSKPAGESLRTDKVPDIKADVLVTIYQAEPAADCIFRNFNETPVDFNQYKQVHQEVVSDQIETRELLENIYMKYQNNHPDSMRSISVSDVVRLNDHFYYVNNVGFQEVKINSFKDKLIMTAVKSEDLKKLEKEQKNIVGEERFAKYQQKFQEVYRVGATTDRNDFDVLKRYQSFIYDNSLKYGLSSVRPNDQKAWQDADYNFLLNEAKNASHPLYLQLAAKTVQIYSPYVEICKKADYGKSLSTAALASDEYKKLHSNQNRFIQSR